MVAAEEYERAEREVLGRQSDIERRAEQTRAAA